MRAGLFFFSLVKKKKKPKKMPGGIPPVRINALKRTLSIDSPRSPRERLIRSTSTGLMSPRQRQKKNTTFIAGAVLLVVLASLLFLFRDATFSQLISLYGIRVTERLEKVHVSHLANAGLFLFVLTIIPVLYLFQLIEKASEVISLISLFFLIKPTLYYMICKDCGLFNLYAEAFNSSLPAKIFFWEYIVVSIISSCFILFEWNRYFRPPFNSGHANFSQRFLFPFLYLIPGWVGGFNVVLPLFLLQLSSKERAKDEKSDWYRYDSIYGSLSLASFCITAFHFYKWTRSESGVNFGMLLKSRIFLSKENFFIIGAIFRKYSNHRIQLPFKIRISTCALYFSPHSLKKKTTFIPGYQLCAHLLPIDPLRIRRLLHHFYHPSCHHHCSLHYSPNPLLEIWKLLQKASSRHIRHLLFFLLACFCFFFFSFFERTNQTRFIRSETL